MKFCRAVSNFGLPGAPKSRQKTSYRPPSAVSPSDARDVVSGTTCVGNGKAYAEPPSGLRGEPMAGTLQSVERLMTSPHPSNKSLRKAAAC